MSHQLNVFLSKLNFHTEHFFKRNKCNFGLTKFTCYCMWYYNACTCLLVAQNMDCTIYFNIIFFFIIRKDLIDTDIEETVYRMQAVIELGRYIRDKKIVPTKVH